MATAPNTGMDRADMKRLLLRSKQEPVNCAVGVGKEQQAMLLLHKTKAGMVLVKQLEKEAGGVLKGACHGIALVDEEQDPKLVVLTLNKAAGGLAAKLKKTLKGTGFTKAMIRLEDGSVAEMAEEDEDERAEGGAAAPEPPEAPAAPAADPAALKRELVAAIGRIPAAIAANPAAKAALLTLANDANTSLKSGDLAKSAELGRQLRDALDAAAAPKGGGTTPMQVWQDAKEGAAAQIVALQQAMRAKEHPLFRRIADQGLNGITGRLQVGLTVALIELDRSSGPGRPAATQKAQAAVADFRSFLQNDPVLPLLEENSLGVPVTLRQQLGRAMDAVETALQA